jgi:subtilisin family serine protease
VRHKQASGAASVRVRIETLGAPAYEVRATLLTIESETATESNRYTLTGEINLHSLEEIAARDEVKSVSLAPKSDHASPVETSDYLLARRLIAAKVAPELAPFVRRENPVIERESASTESVRVIVQANADAGSDLQDAFTHAGKNFQSPDLFAGRISADKLARLAARDDIRFISLDHEMRTQGFSLNETTGRRELLQRAPHISGAGIGIAILDTGVASNVVPNRLLHSVNFVTGETTTNDLNGHGSIVASLAAGTDVRGSGNIAPGAHIVNVRVLNRAGTGLMSDAIKGLEWVISTKTFTKSASSICLSGRAPMRRS